MPGKAAKGEAKVATAGAEAAIGVVGAHRTFAVHTVPQLPSADVSEHWTVSWCQTLTHFSVSVERGLFAYIEHYINVFVSSVAVIEVVNVQTTLDPEQAQATPKRAI